MSSAAIAPEVSPVKKSKATPKKAAAKSKAPVAATHPSYKRMVRQAVKQLKESKGSSRQAVLKYVAAHYKINEDASKISHRVSLALRTCVEKGELKNTKGHGAAGSFVIPSAPAKTAVKKVLKKSPKKAKVPASPKAKKAASPKKSKAAKPKKSAVKKTKAAAPKVKKAKTSPKKKTTKKVAPKKA